MNKKTQLNTIPEAIEAIKNGKIIIVVDDEDRENEGDFIAAAESVTPEMINFMSKHGRGLICAPLTEKRCEELDLPLMVKKNTVLHNTQFTVSIDLIGNGCTTGISAYDRAKTIKALTEEKTKPEDLGRPGHIFPLRAKEGGNEDGTMARLPQLLEVAKKFDLKIISIEDLVAYRMKHDSLIDKIEDFHLETRFGKFRLRAYKQTNNNQIHIALTKGTWDIDETVLTRVNSSFQYNDIIGMLTQEPKDKFSKIFNKINENQKGAIVFINQENQSFNLSNRLSLLKEAQKTNDLSSLLQYSGDYKDFGIGAQILYDLEIRNIKLLSNHTPSKRVGMLGYGLEIKEFVNY